MLSKREPSTVAVPGGAGYIGVVLSKQLLESGYRVRVIDRCFFGLEALEACRAFGSRFELRQMDSRSVGPIDLLGVDAVVDLAGLSNDPSCAFDEGLTHSINVGGGQTLLEAARDAGVRRYIYQSSCSVYGSAGEEFLTEESIVAPLSEYSRSKVEMEELVLKAESPDFDVVITRPGTVFGVAPRMRFDLVINTMTLAAFQNSEVTIDGSGRQWRPFVHVADVAKALQVILEAPPEKVGGQIFNVGDNRYNHRIREIGDLVTAFVPGTRLTQNPLGRDARDYRCDFSKISNQLGFEADYGPEFGVAEVHAALMAQTIDSGVKSRTVDYYQLLIETNPGILSEPVGTP